MKGPAGIILTAAIVVACSALAAGAQEGEGAGKAPGGGSGQKDICLIYPEQCHTTVDTIQERMARLEREIAKGKAVYTEDELSRLTSQLRDAKRIWLYMNGDRPTVSE